MHGTYLKIIKYNINETKWMAGMTRQRIGLEMHEGDPKMKTINV